MTIWFKFFYSPFNLSSSCDQASMNASQWVTFMTSSLLYYWEFWYCCIKTGRWATCPVFGFISTDTVFIKYFQPLSIEYLWKLHLHNWNSSQCWLGNKVGTILLKNSWSTLDMQLYSWILKSNLISFKSWQSRTKKSNIIHK